MYGMVNKALQSLITQDYGEEAWESIKKEAGVEVQHFVSNDGYPDEVTYKLVAAACKTLHADATKLLFAFGQALGLEYRAGGVWTADELRRA